MKVPTLPEPKDDWRTPMKGALLAISPEVAEGFTVSSQKGSMVHAGYEALRDLSEKDRQAVWQTAFPGIAAEIKLAWHHIDPQVMVRRDGGEEGYGTRFPFAPTPGEASLALMVWLRKLLLFTGPYPGAGLHALMANLSRFRGERYDSESGHIIDTDAPAYLASVVLARQAESDLASRLADLLEGQLLGRIPNSGCDRALSTAVFCAERPDLWTRFHRHLAEAGKEPAFLERISVAPIGSQPGAVLDFLRTVRDHDLLRFEAVAQRVRYYFGIEWQWKSHRRDDLQPWFEDWVAHIEAAPGGMEKLPENPGDCLLALWAEAFYDGDSALARIEEPASLGTNARIAAAHFLGLCPAARRQPVAYRYVADPDLRVANIASSMLSSFGSRLPAAGERPELFERLRDRLLALPAKPGLKPCPAPLPSPKLDLSSLHLAVANLFPDGSEEDIEALLPRLDAEARSVVVHRLNRYRLTDFDRELEEIMHGDDPEEWRRWQADHEGSQSMAQRRMLLKLMNDPAIQVAEAAAKAVKGFRLTEGEILLVRSVLKGRAAAKRLLVTRLLAAQSEALLRKLLPELLASKAAGERIAALEILRQLAEREDTAGFAKKILDGSGYRPATAEETRAFEVLGASLQPDEDEDRPGFGNAFGLVDPRSLAKPVEPRVHDAIIIHSPVTLRLIESLDNWLQERADVLIPSPRSPQPGEMVRIGDGQLPYPPYRPAENREEVIARFPPALELAEWWNDRSADHRDPDGFEGLRLEFALNRLLDGNHPKQHVMRKFLFGCEKPPTPKSSRVQLEQVFRWAKFVVPDMIPTEGRADYLIDTSETLFLNLPDQQKNWAVVWGERLSNFLHKNGSADAPRASLERLWALLRNRRRNAPLFLHPILWHVVFLLREGIATEDELIWFLVGDRPFGDYDRDRAFGDLAMATAPPGNYGTAIDFPAGQRVVRKIVGRIVDLELARGEEPEIWSHAAIRISSLYGARHLQRLFSALGKTPLRRPAASRSGKPNLTRNAVLIHLIHVSLPAADDTPETFAALMSEADIPRERLLEIALMRPAWTPFIAHATGIEGLREAVGWIYAHTRSTDYQWEGKAREIWAGELGFDSPLSAEELLEGAVDAEWFGRAHGTVGTEVWETLYAAAKFASTSNGHTRARLFADALLGNIGVDALAKQLSGKGDLNAARAIGLPPLPDDSNVRSAELLRRYGILQKLRVTARKSKAQRRASEMSAFETGIRNLARQAGFDDTVRFEWAMECEAVADLSAASLGAVIDDLECTVVIRPDGSLAMESCRGGKPLANVPAPAKKHDAYKRLKERMDELKEQASRLRPALESLMVRAIAIPVAEWRKILAHPLAGPLVERLLLADASGPLGFPSQQGLRGEKGKACDWPADDIGLHIAHPVEVLPAERWHAWQREVFDRRIIQPFKQIFREVYLPTGSESGGEYARSERFASSAVQPRQALAILSQRGWILRPDDGCYRMFRRDGLCAWLNFEEGVRGFVDNHELTIAELHFTSAKRAARAVSPAEVPARVFSETMRDIDLIASVAHASGAAPEPGGSTLEIRADLIRETCRMLEMRQVEIDGRHARIAGTLGNYRVHLGSGVVHREPGGMLAMKSDPQTERGRIFLPFADDDPQGIEVLSRVLLLADDAAIRDPGLAKALREQAG